MDRSLLCELGEWAAVGYYEGAQLPWPRAYGLAYRRLYENMEIEVCPDRLLLPSAPLPRPLAWADGKWTATSLILDHNHNSGLRVNADIAAARKEAFPQHATFIDALVADLGDRLVGSGGYTHSNPDMRRIVGEGFAGIERELDAELACVQALGDRADAEELNLLLALQDYAAGVRAFHARASQAIFQAASQAAEEGRRRALWLIAGEFARCFLQPAETFVQGLLAVHFAWLLDGCDSIGRPDQVLGALFERERASGCLDEDLARRLLDELMGDFERFNGWNLQLGGYRPEGGDGCNALTLEFLAACGRNRFRRPNVAFRITRDTPDAYLDAALEVLRLGSGRPALYNDDLYQKSLLSLPLGLTPADAAEVGFGGCTETEIAGLSNCGSLEGEINLALALELALFDGLDPLTGRQEGPHTGRLEEMGAYADLEAAVRRQIQYLTDGFVTRSRADLALRFHRGDPKLSRTLFTRDCVARHRSFEAGGARYNWAVVTYQGIANLIDGLAAVRRCVFEERKVAPGELLAALRADFAGYEPLRQRLLAVPKFGNDESYVDEPGAGMVRFAWEQLLAHDTPRGGRYLPACILFVTYYWAGQKVGATPDGRRSGEVLTDSVGPAQGRDVHGPTAMLNSVTRLPLHLAIGTPVLNIRFMPALMASQEARGKVAQLIRAFFAGGGLQIQVSVLDRAAMLEAQREPDKHRDLIVRVGGYSEYFANLNRELQDSIIARTEHGMG